MASCGDMTPCSYAFHPMSAANLPLVRRWLNEPHVTQWWGDPDEQFALIGEDLVHPAMDQFIVANNDRPFAYLQCYDPVASPNNGFGTQPDGTRGIDQFIGEPGAIGCGHGSALIRVFIGRLFKTGAPRVVTDPDPNNARAIRAYEKAGFQKVRLVDTPDGRAVLMVCNA